ncbi:MAG: enoyl-CoA hydratase [Desulfobacteraceae bacterium]|nr:enoyl-CoA hydratase [Desulfobacteraceae bacterium]
MKFWQVFEYRKKFFMEKNILSVQKKNNICTLTLNRPEKRNSLSLDLLAELNTKLKELSIDNSVRTLVIRGAGDIAFSSGFDIRSILDSVSREKFKAQDPLESLFQNIINFPYPVIAMMNGSAYGAGYELALCCDIRIGAEDIVVSMPPSKIGVMYSVAGLQRFIQTLGLRTTKEIFFTGSIYNGLQLKEKGLADYLVLRNELESFTYNMAEKIASNAPLALKGTKRILNLLQNKAELNENEAEEAESIIAESLDSDDLKEGQAAFLEKRKPVFRGK